MPGRFLEIPVFLGDCFIMPHPVDPKKLYTATCSALLMLLDLLVINFNQFSIYTQ